MVRYKLGVILDYIFLSVKFEGALKQVSKSVNVFHSLLSIEIQTCVYCVLWWIPDLSPCGFKEPLVDLRFTTQELIVQFLSIKESIVCASLQASATSVYQTINILIWKQGYFRNKAIRVFQLIRVRVQQSFISNLLYSLRRQLIF